MIAIDHGEVFWPIIMPPVVSSFRSKIADLNDDRRTIASHIHDLTTTLDAATSIEAVKGEMQRFEEKLRELEFLCQVQASEDDAVFAQQFLSKQQGLVQNLHKDLRYAILKAKQYRNKQTSHELLGDRNMSRSDAPQNGQVKESLRRVKANLESELGRTSAANDVLMKSTQTLINGSNELSGYRSTLSQGAKKISVLERRKRRDFYLMLLGWCIFLSTVLFILYRRIFYVFYRFD